MTRQIDANTPPSLLLRLRDRNDQEAWLTFTDVYSPLVYNFCRLRGFQPDDAADVSQEVLLRVAKAISSFEYDRQRGLFRDWLATIVLNEIRRHIAKRSAESRLPEGVDIEATSELWNEQFHQHILAQAMRRTKPQFEKTTWSIFESSWVQKRTAADIAAEHNVDVGTIYVARSRVLKRLRYEVSILADDFF